ncbi:MAG: cation transporter [Clostridia bacterium]|nr:cation transporter [Clostridia bacterium]
MVSFLIRRFTFSDMNEAQKRSVYGYVCGGVGIFFNLLLFTAKLLTGIFTSSISIMADAFNNLTDALSSVISLFGFILSSRKADREHPFGHGRIEYIAGALISVAIIFVGFELLKSSVSKIFNPAEFVFNRYVVIVLLFSALVKLYMAFYNNSCSKKIHSASLRAVAADSISDSISTLAILLSSVFMYFTNIYIDGYVGAIVSALIIRTGIMAVIETSAPLLGSVPKQEFVREVERIVRSNPETIGIHDLVVHDYGPSKVFVSLHMEVDGSKELFALHDAVDLVERQIRSHLGCEAVIHMDPIDIHNPILKEVYIILSKECEKLSPAANIHDLRIVPGPTHTNIIFDLLLPPELFSKKDAICTNLEKSVQNINENYYAVITPEISYCG